MRHKICHTTMEKWENFEFHPENRSGRNVEQWWGNILESGLFFSIEYLGTSFWMGVIWRRRTKKNRKPPRGSAGTALKISWIFFNNIVCSIFHVCLLFLFVCLFVVFVCLFVCLFASNTSIIGQVIDIVWILCVWWKYKGGVGGGLRKWGLFVVGWLGG